MDWREYTAEDRQLILWEMPLDELGRLLVSLMVDQRQSEIGVRLDALTIYSLRDA